MSWLTEYQTLLESPSPTSREYEEAIALKNQNLPDKVYKYRWINENTYDVLKNDQVWMATASTFNDPYECAAFFPLSDMKTLAERAVRGYPEIDNYIDQVKSLAENHYNDPKRFMELLKQLIGGSYGIVDQIDEAFQRAMRVINSNQSVVDKSCAALTMMREITQLVRQHSFTASQQDIKICSFSTRVDSLLMWGHYADSHQGICVEYDVKEIIRNKQIPHSLFPVIYDDSPLDIAEHLQNKIEAAEHSEHLATLLATRKAQDWAYEHEWRLLNIRNPHRSTDVFHPTKETGHLIDFVKPSAIYLGMRVTSQHVAQIQSIARGRRIPIFKMGLDHSSFRMNSDRFSD